MRSITSNILAVVVILLAVYVIVEMVRCMTGKIPPSYVAYTTEFAASLILLMVGIGFLILAFAFFLIG